VVPAPIPSLEEMTTWTDHEILAAIHGYMPQEWSFAFSSSEDGVWTGTFKDAEENELYEACYPDKRLALLTAYGFVWRRLYIPSNSVWQRRRHDLRSVARHGVMGLPGAKDIPDPDDFDPASVYDLDSTGRSK